MQRTEDRDGWMWMDEMNTLLHGCYLNTVVLRFSWVFCWLLQRARYFFFLFFFTLLSFFHSASYRSLTFGLLLRYAA